MAVKSVADLLSQVQAKFGDDTSDETLSFIEDISDTVSDLQTRAEGETNWEQKYKENDAAWRQKYRDRFFSGDSANSTAVIEDNGPDESPAKPKTFNELFEEV